MTLGRTSSGAIKVKTGGGLRAVSCACCGGCGCQGVSIPENLRPLFEGLPAITMWGYAPEYIYPLGPDDGSPEGSWSAYWFIVDGNLFFFASLIYSPGCLYGIIDYNADTTFSGGSGGVSINFGELEGCLFTEEGTGVTGTFTINGTGEFPLYYFTLNDFLPPPPLNIVIADG